MSDLATYLDYGSTEISDDLNPEPVTDDLNSEPAGIPNGRLKMLTDMLATSLEYGRIQAEQAQRVGQEPYADGYSVPQEHIIPGADRWLLNESGFSYDELIQILEVGQAQDGIDWAWSLMGAPTRQWDVASTASWLNPFSAVIDIGHAAFDLATLDASGARDAWNNIGGRLMGYDPNPYGSQIANVLGVHSWQDAIWAGLDVLDLASLGFGGEIIRPLRMAISNAARRKGRVEAVRLIDRGPLQQQFAERAARRDMPVQEFLGDSSLVPTRRVGNIEIGQVAGTRTDFSQIGGIGGPMPGERPFVVVRKADGSLQPFYRSTGENSGMPGRWLPFDGFGGPPSKSWYRKDRYGQGEFARGTPLHRFGSEENKTISDLLGRELGDAEPTIWYDMEGVNVELVPGMSYEKLNEALGTHLTYPDYLAAVVDESPTFTGSGMRQVAAEGLPGTPLEEQVPRHVRSGTQTEWDFNEAEAQRAYDAGVDDLSLDEHRRAVWGGEPPLRPEGPPVTPGGKLERIEDALRKEGLPDELDSFDYYYNLAEASDWIPPHNRTLDEWREVAEQEAREIENYGGSGLGFQPDYYPAFQDIREWAAKEIDRWGGSPGQVAGTPRFTQDEIDEIVRNEGGLTDAELDRLARPEPGVSADPLDEEIAKEIGPGFGPGWKTAADIPASKAGQVWRTPDNVWGTATDEELLVLLHHARMETKRKIDPSLSLMGENRQREFLAGQQADWASKELTNRGYTPTRGIDDPWQELNWGNIGVDRHPSGELFKDFDYEDTLLGIQAKVKSWYDTEYWPQRVAGSKTGLQTPPDLDLDIGPFGQRMGWWLPGTGSEFNADGTQMRLRFYSDQKLIAYMDDRYFQPGSQPRALEYRKMFEDEYARRRAIEAETGKPYDPGPRPPGHPSEWRLPEGE